MEKYVCTNEEDLICFNCINSEPAEDEGYCLCNCKHEDMGELVRSESYCGEGRFVAEVFVRDYKYETGEDNKTREKVYTLPDKTIRVALREDLIPAFRNGFFEW